MTTHPYHAIRAAAIGRVQIARDEAANRQIITAADEASPWCECGRHRVEIKRDRCPVCIDDERIAEEARRREVFGA